jgi:hypothetical protein
MAETNSGIYKKQKDVPVPKCNGYPETDIKSSGIVTRGNGAATKGKTARGPMG